MFRIWSEQTKSKSARRVPIFLRSATHPCRANPCKNPRMRFPVIQKLCSSDWRYFHSSFEAKSKNNPSVPSGDPPRRNCLADRFDIPPSRFGKFLITWCKFIGSIGSSLWFLAGNSNGTLLRDKMAAAAAVAAAVASISRYLQSTGPRLDFDSSIP